MSTVRWHITVSTALDQSLRLFLAGHGGRKGDLSRVIEEAVQHYLFNKTTEEIKTQNAHLHEDEIVAIVEEALQWSTKH